MSEYPFNVAVALDTDPDHALLVAVGDGARLQVYRSLAVSPQAPAYKPVADYIADNRMVLISSGTGPQEGMKGRVEHLHYGTPEARMLWLAANPEAVAS